MHNTLRPDDTTLPHNLKQRTFRRFEPLIARAVQNSPEPVFCRPAPGLSMSTFVARLRDSMLSLERFRWTTEIDLEKFVRLYTDKRLQVKVLDPNRACIGPPDAVEAPRAGEFLHGRTSNTDGTTVWTNPSIQDVNCLFHLLSRRLISGPFRLTAVAPELIEVIQLAEATYDIALDKVNDHTFDIY